MKSNIFGIVFGVAALASFSAHASNKCPEISGTFECAISNDTPLILSLSSHADPKSKLTTYSLTEWGMTVDMIADGRTRPSPQDSSVDMKAQCKKSRDFVVELNSVPERIFTRQTYRKVGTNLRLITRSKPANSFAPDLDVICAKQ